MTGGADRVGCALVERLLADSNDNSVVIIEPDDAALGHLVPTMHRDAANRVDALLSRARKVT